MNRILSGMQPTGNLHLGNYLGALKNWVKLQNDFECYYFIADLHALTVPHDPQEMKRATREVAAAFLAAGVDVRKNPLFVQSAVPAHSELSWILGTDVPLGWLNRMTQFKDKAAKNRDNELLGLYAYPVLMAADILIYKASHVPVGEDQKQHLELTRDIAGAFNRAYKTDYFRLPEPQILGEATRVMSLSDGTKKMSKSDPDANSRINLTDDPDTIAKKFRKAKSETAPLPDSIAELDQRPEANNLITILAALKDSTREAVLREHAGTQFSKLKNELTDAAVAKLTPITSKMRELMTHPDEIDKILIRGEEHANALANKHMREIKEIVGLWSLM